MHTTRRGFLRGLVAVAAATALPMSTQWTSAAAAAPVHSAALPRPSTTHVQAPVFQRQEGADWTELLAGVSVSKLFTPASGALLAFAAGE